ncbi:MAG: hypothetical protein MJ252_00890 [archaeon]|nr:hypothetical protein [archaeon]
MHRTITSITGDSLLGDQTDDLFSTLDKELLDRMNNLNYTGNSSTATKNEFFKRSSSFRSSLRKSRALITCNVHNQPLNFICIDDKMKICEDCGSKGKHSNHKVISEEDLMNQTEKLIDLFEEIDNGLKEKNDEGKLILFQEEIRTVLNTFNNKMEEITKRIKDEFEELMDNLTKQREEILSFIKDRRNEIQSKVINTKDLFDIQNKTYSDKANEWMENVQNTLDILNDINNPSSECLKLLDDSPKKNILSLVEEGNSLFKGLKEENNPMENLIMFIKEYPQKFLKISQIKKVNEIIFNKNQNKTMENLIQNKLYIIKENLDEIQKNGLKEYLFVNPNEGYSEEEDTFEEEDSKNYENKGRINSYNNFSKGNKNRKNSKEKNFIISLEPLTDKSKPSEDFFNSVPIKSSYEVCQTERNTQQNKIKINLGFPMDVKRAKSPNKDKIVFIKSQLRNDSANFSRVSIGEEEINILVQILKEKEGKKYKEIKFVKSNINDNTLSILLKGLLESKVSVNNLNLSSNEISDKSSEEIIKYLEQAVGLKSVYLNTNKFTPLIKDKIKSYSGRNNSTKIFI